MLELFGIWAMIWGFGRLFGWPRQMSWGLIGLSYAAAMIAAFVLPEGHGLRASLGGGPLPLAVFGGVAALIAGYMAGIGKLRAKADEEGEHAELANGSKPTFGETEIERYARHIVLRELGGAGQKRLKEARVLVIGAGGLGSPVLMYLAAAGVGQIGVIDDDTVEHTNMQRQIIHRDEMIGRAKVFSACEAMRAINPYVDARPYERRLNAEIAEALFADYDVIVDGTDNFETRYLANRVAAELGKPLISGALSQWEGQLSVFDPARGGPCYECIFPEVPAAGLAPSCAEAGVVGPLPGVIGSMMALEAVKLISRAGQVTRAEMFIYDGLYGESRKIGLKQRADCPVCRNLKGQET